MVENGSSTAANMPRPKLDRVDTGLPTGEACELLMSAGVELRLLGSLEVTRDGETVVVAAPKERALIALLALDVGRVVSSDGLVDRLWAGDPPASARTALQVYVSHLRKLLGDGVIVTRRPGYFLDVPLEAVDAYRFERLVADGRAMLAAGGADRACAALGQALALWRGDGLAEFVYEDWADVPARQFEELRLVAREDRLDAQLQLGGGAELAGELERLVAEHPERERLRGQHMLALYRAGRQADALAAYQHARETLVRELGIEPSPALVELERRILRHDASLMPVVREKPRATGETAVIEAASPVTASSAQVGLASGGSLPTRSLHQPVCAECGAALPGGGEFCSQCGSPNAAAGTTERQQRKLVTVLFCDLVGSTALGERLDAEVVRGVLNRYFDAASAIVSRHGGSVEKFIGDAVVAIFGVPVIHEDDALRGARAAIEIRAAMNVIGDETVERWAVRLETRLGVSTGEVVVGDHRSGHTVATGDPMNVAARLEQTALPDEILISDATWQLIRDAVIAEKADPLSLKGKAEPVDAYRLISVVAGAMGHARRTDLALVGRGRELALLRRSYERWLSDRTCGLVTILGTAGVGKSRLIAEFLADVGVEARVVAGRCLSYGSGATYWPLAEAIRQLVGIDMAHTPEEVMQRLVEVTDGATYAEMIVAGVAALIGVEASTAGTDEARWGARRLFEHVARDGPLVVVFDDLHCAEAPFLDLIGYLADSITDVPVVLLCMARPELLDERPEWGGGKLNATTILLEPLDPVHSHELIDQLVGGRVIPDELRARVASAAAGNPLFAEELVAYLEERRYISMTTDAVTVTTPLDDVDFPPAIRALIAARLDQLPDHERRILERGAVEGQMFHSGTITALAAGSPGEDQEATLQHLVRKQVLRPEQAALPGQDAYRFRHLLIRDATYEGTPKHQRASWHETFARWLEETVGQRTTEYEELLAYHYLAAYRYHTELGATGTEPLRDRALILLRGAADRELARGDMPNALLLLDQVAEIISPAEDGWSIMLADRAYCLNNQSRMEEAQATVHRAVSDAVGQSRASQIYARVAQISAIIGGPRRGLVQGDLDEARSLAGEAASRGWHRPAARAWIAVTELEGSRLRAHACCQAAERARMHARAADVRWLQLEADEWDAFGTTFGSVPIDDAIRRCEALIPDDVGSHLLVPLRALYVGLLTARKGAVDSARALFDRADALRSEVGRRGNSDQVRGYALLDACLPEAALPYLAASTEARDRSGDHDRGSTAAAYTAHALAELGRLAEARTYVNTAQAWTRPDDLVNQILVRCALARVASQSDDPKEARRWAEEAVELTAGTDFAETIGRALIDLAWVSLQSGNADQALDPAQQAVDLLTRRGAVPMQKQAEALLTQAQRAIVS